MRKAGVYPVIREVHLHLSRPDRKRHPFHGGHNYDMTGDRNDGEKEKKMTTEIERKSEKEGIKEKNQDEEDHDSRNEELEMACERLVQILMRDEHSPEDDEEEGRVEEETQKHKDEDGSHPYKDETFLDVDVNEEKKKQERTMMIATEGMKKKEDETEKREEREGNEKEEDENKKPGGKNIEDETKVGLTINGEDKKDEHDDDDDDNMIIEII